MYKRQGVTTVIGSWAAGMATVPDCGRFAKTDIIKISIERCIRDRFDTDRKEKHGEKIEKSNL